jgi:hypothetical protein
MLVSVSTVGPVSREETKGSDSGGQAGFLAGMCGLIEMLAVVYSGAWLIAFWSHILCVPVHLDMGKLDTQALLTWVPDLISVK